MIDIRTKRYILKLLGDDITCLPTFKNELDACTTIPMMTLDQAMTEIKEGNVSEYITVDTFDDIGSNGLVTRYGFPNSSNFKMGQNTAPISSLIRWILEIIKNLPKGEKENYEKISSQMGALYMM